MNEGGCDPDGRFWCGSMAYDKRPGGAALYRLDPDGTAHRVLDGVTGEELWRIRTGSGATPTIVDGVVYVAGYISEVGDFFWALDAETGEAYKRHCVAQGQRECGECGDRRHHRRAGPGRG